jgi:hypothetical protein
VRCGYWPEPQNVYYRDRSPKLLLGTRTGTVSCSFRTPTTRRFGPGTTTKEWYVPAQVPGAGQASFGAAAYTDSLYPDAQGHLLRSGVFAGGRFRP